MAHDHPPRRWSALLSFHFLGTAITGSRSAQVALLGSFVNILGDLFLSYLAQDGWRERQRTAAIERLAVLPSLDGCQAGSWSFPSRACRTLTVAVPRGDWLAIRAVQLPVDFPS